MTHSGLVRVSRFTRSAVAWESVLVTLRGSISRQSRICAIVQARVSSARLPGKVLRQVRGRPMLQYVIERVQHTEEQFDLVIATSDDKSDDAIEALCTDLKVACHRGPLDDVAGRFLGVIRARPCDAFVRINGDSPLIDPQLIQRGIRLFRDRDLDLVTNVFPRSFPKGQSVEVVDAKSFGRLCSEPMSADEREHVTLRFYTDSAAYRIANFACPAQLENLNLAVDTADDFAAFAALVETMAEPHWRYGLSAILALRGTGERTGAEGRGR